MSGKARVQAIILILGALPLLSWAGQATTAMDDASFNFIKLFLLLGFALVGWFYAVRRLWGRGGL